MTDTDPHTWPTDARIEAVHALILAAEERDGRVTACALRLAIGLGPRVRAS